MSAMTVKLARAVHTVDADDVAAADVRADEGDEDVSGLADERDAGNCRSIQDVGG